MAKLHIKNQLNSGLTIEFCCGEKEYMLSPDEEVTIEVQDEDCMYLDVAYPAKVGRSREVKP